MYFRTYKKPPWILGDDSGEDELSLIDVEKKIRDEISQLKVEKEERMKSYKEAKIAEEAACELTASNPLFITIDKMPTDSQVRQIQDHISQLNVSITVAYKNLGYFRWFFFGFLQYESIRLC